MGENNAKKFQCEMYNMNHGEASFSQSDDTKSQDGAEIEKESEEPTGNIDELGGKNFKIEEIRLPQEVKSENSTVDKENTEVEIKQEKTESENTPNKEGDYKSKSELDDSKTISDDVNPEDKENEKIEIKQEKAESDKKLTKVRSKQSEK